MSQGAESVSSIGSGVHGELGDADGAEYIITHQGGHRGAAADEAMFYYVKKKDHEGEVPVAEADMPRELVIDYQKYQQRKREQKTLDDKHGLSVSNKKALLQPVEGLFDEKPWQSAARDVWKPEKSGGKQKRLTDGKHGRVFDRVVSARAMKVMSNRPSLATSSAITKVRHRLREMGGNRSEYSIIGKLTGDLSNSKKKYKANYHLLERLVMTPGERQRGETSNNYYSGDCRQDIVCIITSKIAFKVTTTTGTE